MLLFNCHWLAGLTGDADERCNIPIKLPDTQISLSGHFLQPFAFK
jgi:hypothetical protein